MQIDKITFNDIAIFHQEEEFSIFHKLNFTKTTGGKEWLRRFFSEPHSDIKRILGTQLIIKTILNHIQDWPADITNGTIVVMEKFFDYNLDPIGDNQNTISNISYRIFHAADYSMAKYSVKHFADFYRGMKKMSDLFSAADLPTQIRFYIDRVSKALNEEPLQALARTSADAKFTLAENLYFAHHLTRTYKTDTFELIDVYSRLEAWYSMALAVKTYQLQFPEFRDQEQPFLKAEGLYHILLQNPTAYNLAMHPDENFLFLTGANMAGKSTLIKSIGSSVFLAHIGMGVPARGMELSLFDGMLSNINVSDNIAKGESYFFNEVQRIKNTIYKIND